MLLKSISLLRDRVTDWSSYPFSVPAIASLATIQIKKPIVFFVGENGSGKSTLLEALAIHYGFGGEGGNRNFSSNTTESVAAVTPLVKALRVAFSRRTGRGFFLRAESFFNIASAVDEIAADDPGSNMLDAYGGRSLHEQSHGESFIALASNRMRDNGFYIMDEPEAALSPQRQLSLLTILHELVTGRREVQVIISTHSPILLAYPNAQILSFDDGHLHEIEYSQSPPYQLYSRFMADPQHYLDLLFEP